MSETTKTQIPRTVVALGLVSLFMDMSSELIHSLMPIFLVNSLGASVLMLGVIEGAAESLALIVKVFSGTMSDFMGRRKPLLLAGYGLAAISKPLFPLSTTAGAVLAARLIDRFGKGIRGAPRDALIADVAPPEIRGACFGLRQSMDTIGAFVGPILAIVLMLALHGNIRAALWWAVLPTVFAIGMLVFGVEEPERTAGGAKKTASRFFSRETLKQFPSVYWVVVGVSAVFTLARFSEAFLVLKAQECHLSPTWIPIVMVTMSVVYSLSAYPAGVISDRRKNSLLLSGMVCLIISDMILAHAYATPLMLIGVAIWGLHMGLTQGIFASMVAQHAPGELRGAAFGVFNLVAGIFMLLSSVIAGAIWNRLGSSVTFMAGAGFATAALIAWWTAAGITKS